MGSTPHLKRLEAESVHLIRAVAEAENPGHARYCRQRLWRDAALGTQGVLPGAAAVSLLHVDTLQGVSGNVFIQGLHGARVWHGLLVHADITQTEGLKQVLDKYQFDVWCLAAFGATMKSRIPRSTFLLL